MNEYGGQAKHRKPNHKPTVDESALHDLDAERAILGAIFTDAPIALGLIASVGLAPDALWSEAHREILRAVLSLHSERVDIEPVSVAARMRAKGTLALIESGAALARFAADVPSVANAAHHAEIVRGLAVRREALALLRTEAHKLADLETPVEVIRERLIRGWPTGGVMQSALRIDDALQARLASMEREAESPTPRVPSSIPSINQWYQGWGTNWLVYVGGRPGMGKTGFVTQEALHAARAGIPTYFASVEMPTAQIVDRMLGNAGGIGVEEIGRGCMNAAQWSKIHRGVGDLANLPLWIDDREQTVDELASRVRTMVADHGIRLVVVDYVQRLAPPTGMPKNARDYDRVTAISQALAALKKELPIAILAAAQLNRDGDDRPPILADLKGSGQLEQDADCVIFPYRPNIAKPEGDAREAKLIVAKCRHGRTGAIEAVWDGVRTSYAERADVESRPAPPVRPTWHSTEDD